MKFLLSVVLVVLATGCASSPWGSAQSGGAVYRYSNTPDGCTIEITSARELQGLDVWVGPDCSVGTTAGGADGVMRVIDGLVKRLP